MLYKVFKVLLVSIAVFICFIFQDYIQMAASYLYETLMSLDLPDWMTTEAAQIWIPKFVISLVEATVICILASPFNKSK